MGDDWLMISKMDIQAAVHYKKMLWGYVEGKILLAGVDRRLARGFP